jgi:phage shock protein A
MTSIVLYFMLLATCGAFTSLQTGIRLNGIRCVRPKRINKISLEMNIVDRFFRVVKSNVNSILSGMEDPEKVLDQAMDDMQRDLVKIRQSYAEISATQKRAIKSKEQAEKLAADWYKRAQLALEADDEELAKEALSRRQIQLESIAQLIKQIDTQEAAVTKLYDSMSQLDGKILDAKRTKDEFVARARTAKTSQQVNDMLSSVTGTTSMDAFERMKEKVENMEAEAEVAGELAAASSGSTSKSMEDRFKLLESGNKVDDELDALRKQLPDRSQKVEIAGELPRPMDTAIDEEYERLKKELGK